MQIFARIAGGKTITLDVNPSTSVADVMAMIEQKEGWIAPCQRLICQGRQLEIDQTLAECKIEKENTLHCVGRLCGQLFIKWQGRWLRRKDCANAYHNFWHDMTAHNQCKRRINDEGDTYLVNSTENFTIYHLQKIVAAFLCLETREIGLAYRESAEILPATMLFDDLEPDTVAFVAVLLPK